MNPATDFFAGLFAYNPLKIAIICISFTISAALSLGFYAIIWYDLNGPNKRRTILNRLVSSVSFASLEYYLIAHILELGRFLVGPMPYEFCLIHSIIKSAIVTQVLLIYNAISLYRYILVFWIKNPGVFKDLFWTVFTNIWVTLFSILSQLTQHFLQGSYSLNIFICNGVDPGTERQIPNYVNIVIIVLGMIIHGLISVRISKFNRQDTRESVFQIEVPSLADFYTNASVSFVFSLPAVLQVVTTILPSQDLNTFPYDLCLYGLQIFCPSLIGMVSLVLFYKRHHHLRNTVKRNFFNFVYTIKE